MGHLKTMKYLVLLILGWVAYLFHVYFYILCIAHPFCVCDDDWITCYPGADDLTGGPGDA